MNRTTCRHRIPALAIIGLFVTAANAEPCDVSVSSPPRTPSIHYASLGSAVSAVPPGTSARITVSGVCKEKVEIGNHVGLTIHGRPGSSLEPPDGDVERHPQVLTIRESDNITVHGLTIRGKPNMTGAVSIWNSRRVEFRDLTIEDGGNEGGVWVISSVGVFLANVTIQNNGNGIRIDGQSNVVLEGAWLPGSTGTSLLQNNGTGARIRNGALLSLRGDTVVRANGVGISSDGGFLSVCCAEDIAHARVEENRFQGLSLRGGDVSIGSRFTVQDNGGFGFVMFGTQVRINDTRVLRNGQGSGGGGIIAIGGMLEMTRGEISGNRGAGLVLTDSQSGRAIGTTITGNGGEGIDAQTLSVIFISNATVVRDNNGFDVRCAPTSQGRGGADGVEKLQCPGFTRAPDPTPGGPSE